MRKFGVTIALTSCLSEDFWGKKPNQRAVRGRADTVHVDPAYAATYQAAFGDSRPDFRTVLFDMNGVDVYAGTTIPSTADNSQAFVNFNPGGKSTVATFADAPVAAGQYFNNNIREYKAMDAVLIFQLEGSQIPEPASIGLVLLGLAGFCVGSRRRSAVA